MSEYSDYFIGEPERETEKAYLAPIVGFTEEAVWIPKSVVEPETKKIKKWFVDKKKKEIEEKMAAKIDSKDKSNLNEQGVFPPAAWSGE
ncbi:MAG: hypothetical protein ACFFDS_03440 [Candidatus Thorarchaeota archaeon]